MITATDLPQIVAHHKAWIDSKGLNGTRADFRDADLVGLDLPGAVLDSALFARALLDGVNLRGARLNKADFLEAQMRNVDLRDAVADGATLARLDLTCVKLQGACIRGADLRGITISARAGEPSADLSDLSVNNSNLQGAILEGCLMRNADFSQAKLNGARMRGSNCEGARFIESVMDGVDLQESNLKGANFDAADLTRVRLQDSILLDADMAAAKGLWGAKIARANVSGAKLPDDVRSFLELASIAEAARNARKLFAPMLLGCLYVLLAALTSMGATSEVDAQLPIVNIRIPILWFFWITPFLLYGSFLYFHLHLQRMWEGLADLPAVFPDGRRLDRSAYPWPMLGLVRRHFKHLRVIRTLPNATEEALSIFLAWFVVPATLLVLLIQYASAQVGSVWSYVLAAVFALSCCTSAFFYAYTRVTLNGTRDYELEKVSPIRYALSITLELFSPTRH